MIFQALSLLFLHLFFVGTMGDGTGVGECEGDVCSRNRVVAVIGGGLAGLSASIEAERAGARVVLFDKEKK